MMPDVYLYPFEVSPNDVKLRDPTVLDGGGPPSATPRLRMLMGIGMVVTIFFAAF